MRHSGRSHRPCPPPPGAVSASRTCPGPTRPAWPWAGSPIRRSQSPPPYRDRGGPPANQRPQRVLPLELAEVLEALPPAWSSTARLSIDAEGAYPRLLHGPGGCRSARGRNSSPWLVVPRQQRQAPVGGQRLVGAFQPEPEHRLSYHGLTVSVKELVGLPLPLYPRSMRPIRFCAPWARCSTSSLCFRGQTLSLTRPGEPTRIPPCRGWPKGKFLSPQFFLDTTWGTNENTAVPIPSKKEQRLTRCGPAEGVPTTSSLGRPKSKFLSASFEGCL